MEVNQELKRNSERVFYIVDLILTHKNIRFSDIQKISGIPKSSLHVLINELVDIEAVNYDNITKMYSIGFNFMQLSFKCISNMDLLKIIDAACLELSKVVKETVHAAILVNTEITYICKHEGYDKVSIINNIGMTLPAHATAIGKSLLSGYSEEEIIKLYEGKELQRYTPNTITTIDKLIEEIDITRERGYSSEHGEVSLLAACIGVPIRQNNEIIASISVTVPVSKFNEEYQKYILDSLRETKQKLEFLINMGES